MIKTKQGKILLVLLVIILLALAFFAFLYTHGLSGIRSNPKYSEGQIKVACVGDSVTYGHSIKGWKSNNYPALLGGMMGENFHVSNFGVSGSTVQSTGDQPYIKTKAYTQSLEYEADILVFMMGSNDSKPENWQGKDKFTEHYNSLLDSYLQNEKKPTVYLCTPPTAYFPEGVTSGLSNYDIQPELVEEIADIIRSIAEERGYELIEINDLTDSHRELFGSDNVHPNNDGAVAIANEVYNYIKV